MNGRQRTAYRRAHADDPAAPIPLRASLADHESPVAGGLHPAWCPRFSRRPALPPARCPVGNGAGSLPLHLFGGPRAPSAGLVRGAVLTVPALVFPAVTPARATLVR